jgi:hypothetical protein
MEAKIFRGTNSLEIIKMETALNDWLKALPPSTFVTHTSSYCSLEGVPSLAITVFWDAGKTQLPAVVTPA